MQKKITKERNRSRKRHWPCQSSCQSSYCWTNILYMAGSSEWDKQQWGEPSYPVLSPEDANNEIRNKTDPAIQNFNKGSISITEIATNNERWILLEGIKNSLLRVGISDNYVILIPIRKGTTTEGDWA